RTLSVRETRSRLTAWLMRRTILAPAPTRPPCGCPPVCLGPGALRGWCGDRGARRARRRRWRRQAAARPSPPARPPRRGRGCGGPPALSALWDARRSAGRRRRPARRRARSVAPAALLLEHDVQSQREREVVEPAGLGGRDQRHVGRPGHPVEGGEHVAGLEAALISEAQIRSGAGAVL